MNSSVYHQSKLVSSAMLTTKGEEDGLEPEKSISSAACSKSSPTGHPFQLPTSGERANARRIFVVCIPAA